MRIAEVRTQQVVNEETGSQRLPCMGHRSHLEYFLRFVQPEVHHHAVCRTHGNIALGPQRNLHFITFFQIRDGGNGTAQPHVSVIPEQVETPSTLEIGKTEIEDTVFHFFHGILNPSEFNRPAVRLNTGIIPFAEVQVTALHPVEDFGAEGDIRTASIGNQGG